MRNVYLLLTDLHDYFKNMSSRVDYTREIAHVIDKTLSTVQSYREKGYNVTLITLGDLFHNSYRDIDKAIYSNNQVIMLRQCVENFYAVVGNHEFTYYRDNPFWSLLTEIESTKVRSMLNKNWQPTGVIPVLRVIDRLEDGEVVFHFNHYDTDIATPEKGKVNIGLFHQDILCKAIIEDMKLNKGIDVFEVEESLALAKRKRPTIYFDKSNVFYGYSYAFMGHLHSIYGTWDYVDDLTKHKTILYYLGSLGRTNHLEVNDKFLERNLPAVIVEDGKFICVEDNKFNLLSRQECVKEDVVAKAREKYEEKKAIEAVRSYLASTDNPIENILGVFNENEYIANMFSEYLTTDMCEYERELQKLMEELQWI